MPPEFKGKLDQKNEFLCTKGSNIRIPALNNDGTAKKYSYHENYYTLSTTTLPIEILNTGNVDVIEAYINDSHLDPDSKEYRHLQERISVMRYFHELETDGNINSPIPVGPMEINSKGQYILPGLLLERPQSSGNGCWSCAMSLILKGRGVKVEQELIRRYRPEFLEGVGPKDAEQTDTMNSNKVSEIFQYAELIGKLCPNTLVKRYNLGGNYDTNQKNAKKYIIDCLTKKNTPVAMCHGNHWVTIVGIGKNNSEVYIADSMYGKDHVEVKSLDEITGYSKVEFLWAESMEMDPLTGKPTPNVNGVNIDPQSGAVTAVYDPNIFLSNPVTQVKGTSLSAGDVEVYVPPMIRDYSIDYNTQKAIYDNYKETNMTEAELTDLVTSTEFQGNKKYTYLSSFTYDKVAKDIKANQQKALGNSRRLTLKNLKKYSDSFIDKMSKEALEKEFVKAPAAQQNVNSKNTQQKDNNKKDQQNVINNKPSANSGNSSQGYFSDEQLQQAIKASMDPKYTGVNNGSEEDEELKKAIEESLKEQFIKEEDVKEEPSNEQPVKDETGKEPHIKDETIKEEPSNEPPIKDETIKEDPSNEQLQQAIKESMDPKYTGGNNISQEDEELKKAIEESLKEQPIKEEVVKEEVRNEQPVKEETGKESPIKDETIKEDPSNEQPKADVKGDNASLQSSDKDDKQLDDSLEKASNSTEVLYSESRDSVAEIPSKDTVNIQSEKDSKTTEKQEPSVDSLEEIFSNFNDRMEKVETSDLPPKLKELESDLLEAQLTLSAAFNGSEGVITEDCIEAAARLMTYATMSKTCNQPGVDQEIINSMTDPKLIEKCVQDMMVKRNGEEKNYAQRVAENLCMGKGRKHVLTLGKDDIYKAMIKEIKSPVKAEKTTNNLSKSVVIKEDKPERGRSNTVPGRK